MKEELKATEEKYEGEIESGDHVIFQSTKNKDTISISVFEVESVDIDEETVKFKDQPVPQPIYRIKQVIKNKKALQYKGYDYLRIEMDEGGITEETYEAIKKYRTERDK